MSLPKRLRDKIEFKHAATPRVDRLLDLDRLRPRRIPNQLRRVRQRPSAPPRLRETPRPHPRRTKPAAHLPRQLCVNPNHMEIRGAA